MIVHLLHACRCCVCEHHHAQPHTSLCKPCREETTFEAGAVKDRYASAPPFAPSPTSGRGFLAHTAHPAIDLSAHGNMAFHGHFMHAVPLFCACCAPRVRTTSLGAILAILGCGLTIARLRVYCKGGVRGWGVGGQCSFAISVY